MKYKALQDNAEIDAFTEVLRNEHVSSYLEIGSKFGGGLWQAAQGLQPNSRIVAIDLPGGTRVWKESSTSLKACIENLKELGHDAHVIWGSSSDPKVIEQVRKLGPYDAVFIDADHRLPGVTSDWTNYGPMGRIVAFHDISWKRPPGWNGGYQIDVPAFWESIRDQYRHDEFRFEPTGQDNGIGVLWRS